MSKWTHPIHARGIRSPEFDVRGGKLLTNKKIDEYARQGRYGEAARLRAQKKKVTKKSAERQMRDLLKKLLHEQT